MAASIAGIAALSFAMLFGGAILLGNVFHIQPTQVFISVPGGLLAVGVSFIGSE
jgi:ABC-type sulfate transport system permease subunit